MKKILTRMLTLFVAIVLGLGAFSGCGLVTTNTDRDMGQAVASIGIGNGKEGDTRADIHTDYVLKKELVSGFLSYGYRYVTSQSYTVSKAYATVFNNLIQSNVVIQQAKIGLADFYIANKDKTYDENASDDDKFAGYFADTVKANLAKKGLTVNAAEDLYNAGVSEAEYKKASEAGDYATLASYMEIYLSEYEIAQAHYNVLKNITSLMESYKDSTDDTAEKENETFSARTAPTVDDDTPTLEYELKKDTDLTDYDYKVAAAALGDESKWESLKGEWSDRMSLNGYVYKNFDLDLTGTDNKSALNKAIKQLKKNGLIANSESYNHAKTEEITKYSYFNYMLKSQYESLLVSKYEESLKADAKNNITLDALKEQFKAEYRAQYANYSSNYGAYETALDAATEEKGVYCNPYGGYGYVLNLLIGFSDEQKNALKDMNGKAGLTVEKQNENLAKMLEQLYAKDQRTTWVQSSYGTLDGAKFTFEDKYLVSEKDSAAYTKLSSYLGEAILSRKFDDAKDSSGVTTTSYSFKNVFADTITYGTFENEYLKLAGITDLTKFTSGSEVTAHIENFTNDSAERKAFDDLIYAFSTDPGCLGKDFGYLYSPYTSSGKYVKEFAEAAAAVVSKGVGYYTIVATEFGYHVILCTKVIEADDVFDANGKLDDAKLNAIFDAINSEDGYKDIKIDAILSDYITKISNRMVNEYIKKAQYFGKAYSDLIESADDPATND